MSDSTAPCRRDRVLPQRGCPEGQTQYLVLGALGMGFRSGVCSIAFWDKQPSAIPQTTKLDKSKTL